MKTLQNSEHTDLTTLVEPPASAPRERESLYTQLWGKGRFLACLGQTLTSTACSPSPQSPDFSRMYKFIASLMSNSYKGFADSGLTEARPRFPQPD